MFCPQCGNELVEGKPFCTKCGAQVSAAPVAAAPVNRKSFLELLIYVLPYVRYFEQRLYDCY